MRSIHSILKTGLLVCCMFPALAITAQPHEFRFFPMKDLSSSYQRFLGKLGSHFFLVNRNSIDGLNLYVYDTVSQTGKEHVYTFPKQLASVLFQDSTMIFTAVSPGTNSMRYHFLEVNEYGNVVHEKDGEIRLLNRYMQMTRSADQKHILFYQFFNKGPDSAIIQGSLVGVDGEVERELAYSFKNDTARNAHPEIFVDNKGNTHILVYDRYDNYKLSTELTHNTISFAREEIVSETFAFNKTKFKTLRLFQNERTKGIQAEGMYTDGYQKLTQGLYSLAFPQGEGNEPALKLVPFDEGMIRNMKKGFFSTDATIRNSLQLQDIIYSDSGSFAVLRLSKEMLRAPNSIIDEIYFRRASPFDYSSSQSLLVSRANKWNAPRLIFVKLGKEKSLDWHYIKTVDVYSRSADIYNRILLVGGESQEICAVLYQADAAEIPQPVFVSLKEGRQTVESIPEKNLAFSPVQVLAPKQYGSLYMNVISGESGIMLISSK